MTPLFTHTQSPTGAKLDEARTDCQQRLVAALKEFRILQAQVLRASGGMHNQLLYPDTLKFLPVWTLGMCVWGVVWNSNPVWSVYSVCDERVQSTLHAFTIHHHPSTPTNTLPLTDIQVPTHQHPLTHTLSKTQASSNHQHYEDQAPPCNPMNEVQLRMKSWLRVCLLCCGSSTHQCIWCQIQQGTGGNRGLCRDLGKPTVWCCRQQYQPAWCIWTHRCGTPPYTVGVYGKGEGDGGGGGVRGGYVVGMVSHGVWIAGLGSHVCA